MGLMGIKKGLPAFHGLDASGDFTSSAKELSEDRIVYVRQSSGTWVAAFDQRYKLILSVVDKPWLFDLEKDPDELTNQYGREGYQDVSKRLKKELLSQMKKFKEPALAEGKLRYE
jgi:arylsulfatase A-like enzyme